MLHFVVQPGFGHAQVASDGHLGELERLCDFPHGKAAKITELDHFALSRVNLLQSGEAGVERHEVLAAIRLHGHRFFEMDFESRSFAGLLTAGVVYQNLTHQARRHAIEVRAVLPGGTGLIHQTQVRLMHQRGGLQGVAEALSSEIGSGKLPQFRVYERGELVQGLLAALGPFGQQHCNFVGIGHSHHVVKRGTCNVTRLYTLKSRSLVPAARAGGDVRFRLVFAHESIGRPLEMKPRGGLMKTLHWMASLLCAALFLQGCGGGNSTPPVPVNAFQFVVTTSAPTITAGTALSIGVRAIDVSGATVSNYRGTVHFTSSDPQAVLPKDATLSNGTGTFSVTLKTSGGQGIVATDTLNFMLVGSVPVTVNPGPAAQLSVSANSAATVAIPLNVTVSALDAYMNVASGYAGTVKFASSDPQSALPANSTLTNGAGTFSVTFKTIGSQTVTVSDAGTTSLKATSGSINVVSNTATQLSLTGVPPSTSTRATFKFTVTALDGAGHVSVGYAGTVHFSSNDTQAKLPLDSNLTGGTGNFSATLETAGNDTLSATDASSASITGSDTINVAASAPLAISSAAPPSGTVGSEYNPHNVQICIRVVFGMCQAWRTLKAYGFDLTNSGGVAPYNWSWAPATGSSVPPGLSVLELGNSSCTAQGLRSKPPCIFGTPTQTGTYNVVLTVSDSGVPAVQTTANYAITINLPPPPTVNTNPAPPPGVENLPYRYTFTATGGSPFTWSESGALPAGLSFSNSSGTLSGTPTQTGSFPITVTATDQFSQSSAATGFTIVVTAHGFVATGSMATARRFHTATLLSNGKVLVAGGEDGSANAFASAELYDPTTGSFSPTGSMTVPRVGHTATLLSSGKVLITGGTSTTNEAAVASAELYDPVAGTFAATTGNMIAMRASHTATVLKDGRVLVAGGDIIFFNGVQNSTLQSLASAEIFDPNTETFSSTGSMTVARESHTATLLTDGRVLIAGGSDGALGNNSPVPTVYASAELFDPNTGHFTAAGNMAAERDFFTATLLGTGKVLVAGGVNSTNFLDTSDLFDPSSASFAATGNLTATRFYHDATLLKDGTVLLTGGVGASPALATAEIYDPTAGTFAATGSMISPRVWHTATLLQDGRVLVTGGSAAPFATAELYQ